MIKTTLRKVLKELAKNQTYLLLHFQYIPLQFFIFVLLAHAKYKDTCLLISPKALLLLTQFNYIKWWRHSLVKPPDFVLHMLASVRAANFIRVKPKHNRNPNSTAHLAIGRYLMSVCIVSDYFYCTLFNSFVQEVRNNRDCWTGTLSCRNPFKNGNNENVT